MLMHDYIAQQMFNAEQRKLQLVTRHGWRHAAETEDRSGAFHSLVKLLTKARLADSSLTVQEECCCACS